MERIATVTVPKMDGKGVRTLNVRRNEKGEYLVCWQETTNDLGRARVQTRSHVLSQLPASHPYRVAAEARLSEVFAEFHAEQNRQP